MEIFETKGKLLLQVAFIGSTIFLISGLTLCLISLDDHAYGLYMILVAIVGYIISFSFCVAGSEDRRQPSIAKKLWQRYTTRRSKKLSTVCEHSLVFGRAETGGETERLPSCEDECERKISVKIDANKTTTSEDSGSQSETDEMRPLRKVGPYSRNFEHSSNFEHCF